MENKKEIIIKIILSILVILLIVFMNEIKIYNTTITNENYEEIIIDVKTSKLTKNQKQNIILKLLFDHKKYIGMKVRQI